jgi:hypothetical protein
MGGNGVMVYNPYSNTYTGTNVGTDLNNQMAYLPGTTKDMFLKNLYEMKNTYGDTPAYQQNLQKDWDNFQKKGDPLSLPKKEYSGVEGFASLNDPYAGIAGQTAMLPDNMLQTMTDAYSGPTRIGEDTSDLSGMAEVYRRAPLNQTNYPQVYRRPPLNQTNYPQPNIPFQDFSFSEYQGPSQEAEGITATDAAQKQGWFQNLMENTMLGKIASMNNPLNRNAANYNPALQGQVEDLRNINFLGPTSEGYQLRGGPLAGQNLVSMFGTNDYDEMLANKAGWFQARKDAGKGFSQDNWDAVIAEQKARELENKARADAAAAVITAQNAPGGRHDYDRDRGGGYTLGAGFADRGARPGADVRGHHSRAQGGYMRRGYSRGGRVGILAAF